jgi:hypothetical protein
MPSTDTISVKDSAVMNTRNNSLYNDVLGNMCRQNSRRTDSSPVNVPVRAIITHKSAALFLLPCSVSGVIAVHLRCWCCGSKNLFGFKICIAGYSELLVIPRTPFILGVQVREVYCSGFVILCTTKECSAAHRSGTVQSPETRLHQ